MTVVRTDRAAATAAVATAMTPPDAPNPYEPPHGSSDLESAGESFPLVNILVLGGMALWLAVLALFGDLDPMSTTLWILILYAMSRLIYRRIPLTIVRPRKRRRYEAHEDDV